MFYVNLYQRNHIHWCLDLLRGKIRRCFHTLLYSFPNRSRHGPSPPCTRTIEEVSGSDKLMGPPTESGYSTDIFIKSRNSGTSTLPSHSQGDEGLETVSIREYKGRNGSELAHVHLQDGGGGVQYGRAGFPPHPYPTGTLGRPAAHLYESPKFS